MTASIVDSQQALRFRSLVTRRLGLHFDDAKLGFLSEVLQRRITALGRSCEDYLDRFESDPSSRELGPLASELTVSETYFFRHREQMNAFREVALPQRLAQIPSRHLRFLSAGCASGEEAYSLAMLVRQEPRASARQISIIAVDVNPAVLERARRGRYASWALRDTPPDIRSRWFRREGSEFQLDDSIREPVSFYEHNLIMPGNPSGGGLEGCEGGLWAPETYDVVFCRNVLMYLTPEAARTVVAKIARAMGPGGFLFLGHAETLRGLSHAFHLRHTHETFYYQRRDALNELPATAAFQSAEGAVSHSLPEPRTDSGDWVSAINAASDRVEAIVRTGSPPISPGLGIAHEPQIDVKGAEDLLRQERFVEALSLLQGQSSPDPDVLLLRAVLLAQSGQVEAAEEVAGQLLQIDELTAGAHYVLAVCREATGKVESAVTHHQAACYLDPAFAMPRLHLGLLARRADNREAAHRELSLALDLLDREEGSRLLLFGGGFGREALKSLCCAEMAACEAGRGRSS